LDSSNVCASHFFGIAWPDVEKIRHCAPEGCNGNRLVCRTILANADAVVRGNVDLLEALECGHAYRSSSVQVEDEICTRHGDKCAPVEGGETVCYRAHCMLADTIVNISTIVIPVETAGCSEVGLFHLNKL
jgi:hypothetical protein